jgi:hypothetical protein
MAAILGLLGGFFGPQYFLGELIASVIAASVASPGLAEPNLPAPHYRGVASRFGDLDDKWVGGNLKCDPTRRVMPHDHICAHRTLSAYKKCGTVLLLENPRTKKRSWCMVMDSGPFGARIFTKGSSGKYTEPVRTKRKNGRWKYAWYIKIRRSDKPPASKCPTGDCVGRWRGYLDISPAAAIELGHNGMERINAWEAVRLNRYLQKRRRLKKKKRQVFLYEAPNVRDRVAVLWGL